MRFRVLLALAAALGLLVGAAAVALGEDAPVVRTQAVDSIPAAWCYAALGAVATAGVTLGGVITKLYFGGLDKDKILATVTDAAGKALGAEKDARREEAERLLREAQATMKEALLASAANAAALKGLSETVADLAKAIQHLIALVEKP